MKTIFTISILLTLVLHAGIVKSQDQPAYPTIIRTGTFLGISPPLRDLPVITEEEFRQMEDKAREEERNPELRERSYPFAATALPKGADPVWQKAMGKNSIGSRAPVVNFQAQTSPYYPPDANGVVGPNHYMQTVNLTYAIYDKTGAIVAGPTNMNTLFSGVPGSSCNDGDPVVLYDEQADRWLATEFSICGSNDYMLVAVSTTNDPTGAWYKYSFDVADMPDYPKFGVWRDGYYMGTNNSSGNDIYVFERSVLINGGANPQMVAFNNPWRPTTIDGFMCVPPLDNDGAFAPSGSPGLFITINDDAIAGGNDQLWIYELAVDWAAPASSTFNRVQQIDVAPFDSNFGTNWENIAQLGTTRQLDAIPQVVMNPPQYRNFGSYQTIVCCHTVDVDHTDHAGIRWYELRKTTGTWSVRQQGTYAPDAYSRWMGSIMLNGQNELAMGYSISSYAIYPGIKYCGQSAVSYAEGNSTMDIAEENIQGGLGYQSTADRWGDYSSLSVDPLNDSVFWFTNEYLSSGGSRLTRVAAFNIPKLPGIWTGVASNDWSNGANWLDGNVPGGNVDVTIKDTAQNWPIYSGNLTLGTNCGNVTLEGASELTVSGNLTISAGKRFDVTDSGTVRVGGNWNNLGTFNYGAGTVEFTGNADALVSGKTLASTTISEYNRDTFALGMTVLSNPASGPTGDNGSSDVTLPFTFHYAGTAYTAVHICTNGWISLNGSGATGNINNNIFTTSVPNTTIAPWFDDLRDDNTSSVNYKTEGSAPGRIFTVEWYRVDSWSGAQGVRISFQVKLFETTNVIEFHYGTVEGGLHASGESASIGIEDATGGAGHFIEGSAGYRTTGLVNLTSQYNWPEANIRFTPPSLVEEFYNLTIDKSNASLTVSNDVIVHGSLTVNEGAEIDIPGTQTINVLGSSE